MLPDEQLGDLRDRFDRFVEETRERSPLYARLSGVAARDDLAIELLARAPDERQRRPNLLFAAVHDLLLAGHRHPLARYYPSVGGDAPPDRGADDAFLHLVRAAREELLRRVTTRATQTNEVGRCGALWPALRHIAERFGAPLTLVELGSSAGLLLHPDRYGYDLGGTRTGEPTSPVRIAPELVGAPPPAGRDPAVVRRVGIDLSPLDPADPDDARWVEACVWPEDVPRRDLLRAALEVARRHDDVEVVAGDVAAVLRPVLASVSADSLPVVVHSAALAYLDPPARAAVTRTLAAVGADRDLAWVSLEGPFLEPFRTMYEAAGPAPEAVVFALGLTVFAGGERDDRLLARSHPHGLWLEWLDGAAAGTA